MHLKNFAWKCQNYPNVTKFTNAQIRRASIENLEFDGLYKPEAKILEALMIKKGIPNVREIDIGVTNFQHVKSVENYSMHLQTVP